jgi:Arc/MetJ-type ribon-helix-helix transcriptional regulator
MLGIEVSMIQDREMPPKLANTIKKLNLILPDELVKRINAWRGRQDAPPNVSQAIRELLELALDAADAGDKPKKKPKG